MGDPHRKTGQAFFHGLKANMPQWIYNRPPDKCQSSELKVAQVLNETLGDDWLVRWGYWYEDDAGTMREGDFLILGQYGGVAVLEVKTNIAYQAGTGEWNTEDRDNPVTQLLAQHKGVIRLLQEHANGNLLPFVVKALVLPNGDIASNIKEYRGVPRDLILAANDLRQFGHTWDRLFPGRKPVNKGQRQVFMTAYGECVNPKTIKAFVTETDKIILRQASASYRLLDMLAGNRQLVVEGGMGTGKSWYALESARRLAENAEGETGRDVLMMAYNLALCERLRTHVARMRLARGSITVQSSEALAASILKAVGLPHEVPETQSEKERYFDETLPMLAIECLDGESAGLCEGLKRFDALVVDESQDHDTTFSASSPMQDKAGWWSIYVGLLREGWNSPMALYGDASQRPPFRPANRFDWKTIRERLSQHSHVSLHESLRYTGPIYQFLKQLNAEGSDQLAAGLRSTGRLLSGPEICLLSCSANEVVSQVESVLKKWEKHGYCLPNEVLIIYDRSHISKTALAGLETLLHHPLRPYLETLDANGRHFIGHNSIHKSKGLDALGVILVGMRRYEDLKNPQERFTYFMGASRARQLLACVHLVDEGE
jgi:hypothetical protein